MAHLWIRESDGRWAVFPLERRPFDLATSPPRDDIEAAAVVLAPVEDGNSESWALISDPKIRVFLNGSPVFAGIRSIADHDEIRVDGAAAVFFSSETLAHVEDFAGAGRDTFCGRCRQQINKGDPAVRCPRCGVWYNQSETLPCWTYAEKCAFCPQLTSLDAGFEWVPEE